jgi:hypothetical protein
MECITQPKISNYLQKSENVAFSFSLIISGHLSFSLNKSILFLEILQTGFPPKTNKSISDTRQFESDMPNSFSN